MALDRQGAANPQEKEQQRQGDPYKEIELLQIIITEHDKHAFTVMALLVAALTGLGTIAFHWKTPLSPFEVCFLTGLTVLAFCTWALSHKAVASAAIHRVRELEMALQAGAQYRGPWTSHTLEEVLKTWGVYWKAVRAATFVLPLAIAILAVPGSLLLAMRVESRSAEQSTPITSVSVVNKELAPLSPPPISSDIAQGASATLLAPVTPDAIANGFSTLVGALLGALVGAMLAHLLQRKLQKVQEKKAALMSAHHLMFTLLQQINTILLIQRKVHPELENPGRFLSIAATPPFDTKKDVLALTDLHFLMEEAPGRKLLFDFYIAQENYVEALNQWNLRSSFHLERLQPALAASGIQNGDAVTNEMMRRALGDQVYFHAINATNNSIECLQRAFEALAPLKKSIREYLVDRFKSQDFTRFEFPETWGLKEKPDRESTE